MKTPPTKIKNEGFLPMALSMAVITGIFLAFQKIYFKK
jgi:hypothetical protein